ncbi:type II toxin-antitoxin system VapC family toxin [Sphingobium boeckii]|uniref:PIN domain nuclease of toxin-antitoxin system n=1 Tax=Sphingobium boeckii TaxID=1082345 RepID=A0A7W9AFD8_9SPHN|nr:type II toxin-antitoxin system VapC family toxin [Sphingobium boeckii]MBB5684491.1 PIN domain nuclease of toxin-antitoxin system [Sphingobium boeckii]
MMAIGACLLDTHAALWWWCDSPMLGPQAREVIAATEIPMMVSVTSALEISIKYRLGKLPDIGDPRESYGKLMARNGFKSLEITEGHAMKAGLLPGDHRDPFDRLIAAQALIEGLTVVTRDPAFAAFGCDVIW